jgi:hypothetical protein
MTLKKGKKNKIEPIHVCMQNMRLGRDIGVTPLKNN